MAKILKLKPGVHLRDVQDNPQFIAEMTRRVNDYLREGFYDKDLNPICRERVMEQTASGLFVPVQEMTGPGQTPAFMMKPNSTQGYDLDDQPADTQYLQIFGVVQSDSESETYGQIWSAITFEELQPFQRVTFGKVDGTEVTLVNKTWGAGFAWLKQWIEDNKVWKIEEVISEAKVAAFDRKAQIMYDLLRNGSFNSTAKSTDSWIAALNKAYVRLERKNDPNSGRPILGPNQTPVLVAAPEYRDQIEQAIKDSAVASTRGERINFSFNRIYTKYYKPSDTFVDLVVPGKRNFVLQERLALDVEEGNDPTLFGKLQAWRFRMNAMIRRAGAGERITL